MSPVSMFTGYPGEATPCRPVGEKAALDRAKAAYLELIEGGFSMRSLMIPVLLALALGACASAPKTKTYSGTYISGMAVETFTLDGGAERHWVVAERDAREALQALVPNTLAPGQGARVAVVVEGQRSRRGQYGPMGAYEREMLIRRVVSARLIDPAPEGGEAIAAARQAPEAAPRRRGWWPFGQREASAPASETADPAPAETPPAAEQRSRWRWPWSKPRP